MKPGKSIKSNPFDLEAVATYGEVVRSCDTLQYMQPVKDELYAYLQAYPNPERRFGGALGLVGGHGSGKTHLLSRLADSARESRRSNSTVLYAKADSANLFEVYGQFMTQLKQERIEELIGWAHFQIAIELVTSGKATQDLEDRIASPEDLPVLYEEGNINPDQIRRLLQERLEQQVLKYRVPKEILRTVLQVGEPGYGEKAYHWLKGDNVEEISQLGLEAPLRSFERDNHGDAASERTAIHVLEVLAALHQLASIPFILLIDQLEVLLRTEGERAQTLYSLIKKLIEQTGREKTLLIIAGNAESWLLLPRDVPPRLRVREPFRVGILERDEVELLMRVFTKDMTGFSQDALDKLVDLSGGSPRELIRIGYHAYQVTKGQLAKADEELLLKCARKSGTIADRRRYALQIADKVLQEQGSVSADIESGEGVRLDRLLTSDAGPLCALLVITATDKLSEITSARAVAKAVVYAKAELSGVPIIVVSVGYSSDEVHSMLEKTTTPIVFDELQFESKLRAKVVKLVTEAHASAQRPGEEASTYELLQNIAKRLDRLEVKRRDEVEIVRKDFAEEIEELAKPAIEARQARTRWELLEQLDELALALQKNDLRREQNLIRSMLIANESQLHLDTFEQLGGIYLDHVSRGVFSDSPRAKDGRAEILIKLKGEVRRRNLLDYWLSNSVGIIAGLGVTGFVGSLVWNEFFLHYSFNRSLLSGVLVGGVCSVAGLGLLMYMRSIRRLNWRAFSRHVPEEE